MCLRFRQKDFCYDSGKDYTADVYMDNELEPRDAAVHLSPTHCSFCTIRPYQHGGDMLAAITDMLTQCSQKDQATPAALALQGLHELCRAEVRISASLLQKSYFWFNGLPQATRIRRLWSANTSQD